MLCLLGLLIIKSFHPMADVFRKQIESEGLRFEPLKGAANLDYRTFLPESKDLKPGPEEMIYKVKHVFGNTMLPMAINSPDRLIALTR